MAGALTINAVRACSVGLTVVPDFLCALRNSDQTHVNSEATRMLFRTLVLIPLLAAQAYQIEVFEQPLQDPELLSVHKEDPVNLTQRDAWHLKLTVSNFWCVHLGHGVVSMDAKDNRCIIETGDPNRNSQNSFACRLPDRQLIYHLLSRSMTLQTGHIMECCYSQHAALASLDNTLDACTMKSWHLHTSMNSVMSSIP